MMSIVYKVRLSLAKVLTATALSLSKRIGEPDVFHRIVELAVALVVVGVLFPIAMPYILTATFGTGSLATTLTTLFQTLVSIVAIIAVVLLFLSYRKPR
jgi:hypothetical protein